MTPAQLKTLDFVRGYFETHGIAPTLDEIAGHLDSVKSKAHERVAELNAMGLLIKLPNRKRGIALPDRTDLRGVPTPQLQAELARRGKSLGAFDVPERFTLERGAVTCAVGGCRVEVERGHLMCRRHWFELPADLRRDLLASHALARRTRRSDHAARYQQLYTLAIDGIADGRFMREAG